jgi:hypothetical protein
MRTSLLVPLFFSVLTLLPGSGRASDRLPEIVVSDSEKHLSSNPTSETYRNHFLDLSAIAGRQDFVEMNVSLRHQIDIAEDSRLSPRVLEFFRAIPITVNEVACLDPTKDKDGKDLEGPQALLHDACYGPVLPESSRNPSYGSVWDSSKSQWTNSDPIALAVDTNLGVIMLRPIMLGALSKDKQRPVVLHELLHAYHNLVMPLGFRNPGILMHYKLAKSGELYPADAYLMSNEKEFFAVTASVFLYGNDGPISRSNIKEKQPDYYKYLVFLFGFDPDRSQNSTPVASLTLPDVTGVKSVSPNAPSMSGTSR